MTEKSYIDWSLKSDSALTKMIGVYIKHHRLNKNLSQDSVAASASISRSTLSLLERGEGVNLTTLIQILRVLDLLYIMDVFQVKEDISPLAYAKLKKKQKQRASGTQQGDNAGDLGW